MPSPTASPAPASPGRSSRAPLPRSGVVPGAGSRPYDAMPQRTRSNRERGGGSPRRSSRGGAPRAQPGLLRDLEGAAEGRLQKPPSAAPSRSPRGPACAPRSAPRELRRGDPPPAARGSTWCGAASRRTASTRRRAHAGPRAGAGDDRSGDAGDGQGSRGAPGSPTATPDRRPRHDRRPGPAGYADGVPRRAATAPRSRSPADGGRCAAGSAWTSSWSTWTATRREPGTDVVVFGPAGRRADRPGLGRGVRHHQLRDRHPDRRPDGPPPRGRGTRRTG